MTDNPFDHDYVAQPVEDVPEVSAPTSKPGKSRVVYHRDLIQGEPEWHAARLGILTASEMKLIITPSLKIADNEKVRIHLYELLAQRVTNYVEPHFQSYDMERGNFVEECGFITNDKWGFTIGYSPDGLVGDDGLIECKSRVQKWQMKTLVESVSKGEIPDDYVMQVQTALLVSEREWCDFISYSGGMVMPVVRCHAIPEIQDAIVTAATAFERRLTEARKVYDDLIASNPKLIPTERLLYI